MLLSREIGSLLRSASNNSKLLRTKKNLLIKNVYTSPNYAASVSFNLSDIGEGIREVVVKEWFVKVGDRVAQFDEICEVQSDKASVTITSRYDGVIKKLHHKVDEIALVGKPLLDVETDDGPSEEQPVEPPEQKVVENLEEVKDSEKLSDNSGVLCIPSVRRLAKEYNVDLAKVTGSGKDGRILKEDVLKYLNISSGEDVEHKPAKHAQPTRDKTESLTPFQKAMVKTMTTSLKIPHVVYGDEIIVTKLSELRRTIKTLPEGQDLKLSFMPFFIKAASNALLRFPILNATLDENCENITYRSEHNIGVAMDTKAGLGVPVIKNVQSLSIIEINDELNRLLKTGKSGTFSTQDLTGGTFTISNIGAIGGTYMKPVIMPPQVALIAIGAIQVLPRFDDSNNVVAEDVVNLSGAADHRIIDGATIARFAQLFKKQLQNPYLLFLNL